MTTIRLSENKVITDILVVGLARNAKSKKLIIESGEIKLDVSELLAALEDMGATGSADEIIKLPGATYKLLVLTGLGETTTNYSAETLRRAAGAAARSLAGAKSATFALPHSSKSELAAVAEGALLGAYAFDEFRGTSKSERKAVLSSVTIFAKSANSADAKAAIKRATVIAENTHIVRDLINTPPSHLTPESFCARIKKVGIAAGLKVEIFTDAQLKAQGFGGIVGVGQGSANPPRLLHLSYQPKN
ncbi:MAG: leucyl aminopeptidase, partial [Actinobacteria bacterium]|nr:leucyl aminopeptidase [Actinomycetota bacterium]MSX85347.1 leucyl aminopeptidase [Actinomycetota bacterium]